MITLLVLCGLSSFQDDPETPVGGHVTWYRDPKGAVARAGMEKRAIVFYFHDGGMISRGVDGSIFASEELAKEMEKVVAVFVDCSKEDANEEIRKRYEVSAFPMLVAAEPDGKPIGEVSTRDVEAVLEEIRKLAQRFPGVEPFFAPSLEAATRAAREEKKPLAILFHEEETDLGKYAEKLQKDLGKTRVSKAVWAEVRATEKDDDGWKKKIGYQTLPSLVLADPKPDELKDGVLKILWVELGDKPKVLKDFFDDARKNFKK